MTKLRMPLLAVALGGLFASSQASASFVSFNPGTYHLAESNLGTAVDTLKVTLSGGVADFTVSGQDDATFSIVDYSSPAGFQFSSNPYFSVSQPAVKSFSWNGSTYPYLTFWTTGDRGGFTIGSIPGDLGSNFISTFQSTQGTGQVFTLGAVPEPSTWAFMIVGLGLTGWALRNRANVRNRRVDLAFD